MIRKVGDLAAPGSTGNNTHASVSLLAQERAESLAVEFEVTIVGTTITFKLQGSQDDPAVTDAASDWFDLSLEPQDGTAAGISFTKTAVGVSEYTLDLLKKPCRKVRLVTSANTGVTYESELFASDTDT